MVSLMDFLTGGNSGQPTPGAAQTPTPAPNYGGDPTGTLLGNLLGNNDPATTANMIAARQQQQLWGLSSGLLGQGYSRLPQTFGQGLSAGMDKASALEGALPGQALQSAQPGR